MHAKRSSPTAVVNHTILKARKSRLEAVLAGLLYKEMALPAAMGLTARKDMRGPWNDCMAFGWQL